jgi:hypothetical protein
MIKFSRATIGQAPHDTAFCNSLCNVCIATGTNVYVSSYRGGRPERDVALNG